MGLAEIVDFARNFAVMVRVRGPDPKGVKMRNHAFHQRNSGITTLSVSGMLLPGPSIVSSATNQFSAVVTVASVLEPFLSLQHRENMSHDKPELIPGVLIDIMVEGKNGVGYDYKGSAEEVPAWLSAQLIALVDVPLFSSAVQSLIQASSGSVDHGWEVGWSLASCNDATQPLADAIQTKRQGQRHLLGEESSNPSSTCSSTAKIAILGVSTTISKDLPNLNVMSSNKRGDLLLAVGSPFGILSPVHFFNSISVGSVANCYPSGSGGRSLLMADIRCLPGMEGSPVFGEDALLAGILARPLRQKKSGAEIQLVIPWEAIATACSDLLQEEPQNAYTGVNCNNGNLNAAGRFSLSDNVGLIGLSGHLHEQPISSFHTPSPVEKAMASVCLITIDNEAWASGVLLNNEGLILTNAHLLEPWRFQKASSNSERNEAEVEAFITSANDLLFNKQKKISDEHSPSLLPTRLKTTGFSGVHDHGQYNFSWITRHRKIRVRLGHMDPWIWCDAKVVFVSKGPLDVALLQLEFVPDHICPIVVEFTCPLPGSKVYVIGHGLLGPKCEFPPSACAGVVAKVVVAKKHLHRNSQQDNAVGCFPAMLETTAAVHPGGSGGAIVNSDGCMIGLVTSNARHGGGVLIPNLNFSIPCAALEPVFKFSKDMQGLSLLEDLNKPNEHLSSVWALIPPLSPKPGLPIPGWMQPGDVNKDGKGSRFAKFMAERQDLMIKERSSKEFTRSKL